MSTEDPRGTDPTDAGPGAAGADAPRPLTRAEARARREAEAARAAATSPEPAAPVEPTEPAPMAEPAPAAETADPAEPAAPDEPMDPAPTAEPAEQGPHIDTAPVWHIDPAPGARRDPARTYPGYEGAPVAGEAGAATDGAAAASSGRGRRPRFALLLGGVLGALVLLVGGLSAVSLIQGPRVSSVSVDPRAAIESSGTRLILRANEPLAEVAPEQVTIEPAVPFTLDTAGRALGIRFTVPLDDDTEYAVTVADVTGTGGGPAGALHTTFRTPESQIFLLQRDAEGDDTIFRTDLGGERAVPVYSAAQIQDFRATADRLVVAVEKGGLSSLRVMDLDGTHEEELPLPGDGYLSMLQVSDRGGLVGYTFTDEKISATSGRASVLVTQSVRGGDPRIVEVGGSTPSVAEWQFVPDTSSALFVDFTGTLWVDDRSAEAGATNLGLAQSILGISRGTYTAIIERSNTLLELDLADGSEKPLAPSNPDYGLSTSITPFPGGTLRHTVDRDASGLPTGQGIARVDDDGTAQMLLSVTGSDAIMQACPSPSGQYSAIVVAPNLVENPYDRSLLPLPKTLQTHILDTRTGEEKVVLAGFDASWCAVGPRR
ncbi:hypothetical protein [Microbacterium resistens]|uniref:hypothetical protein n=1 Tax=Microbacterium resistens TaxID=156977 RepID=UPI001F2CACA1|nr:hypothetical protein [Microbacterium resistens]